MKQLIIVSIMIALVAMSAFAAVVPTTTWKMSLHSGARSCEDSDWITGEVAQGNVAQQSTTGGVVKGVSINGKKFMQADKCLNSKILQEGSCHENNSRWGSFKHLRGKFVQWYDVTCPTQCNPADGVHTAAWCS